MIEFISSWTGGIVISVIIATILEMILPEGKNKKYIKTVIGVYILFAIVSPIISQVTGKGIDINRVLEIEGMINQNTIEVSSIDTSKSIEEIYITNLKQDIKVKLEEKGYQVNSIELKIETINQNNYGKIEEIKLNLIENKQKGNAITVVNKVEIEISDNTKKTKEMDNIISNSKIKELQEYLGSVYDIEKYKVKINEN